ncbi:MAG: hypothetical protein M9897_00770 [Brumimicrobium sp.]|nr:hypothetical protein [Brumimicrobium sp.]
MYYYYYYGSPKADDIKNIAEFLKDSSTTIFELVDIDEIEEKFYHGLDDGGRNNINVKEWVEDVKVKIKPIIRDLNLNAVFENEVAEKWDKFDEVGLTDVQLKSKLAIWNIYFEKVKEFLKQIKEASSKVVNFISDKEFIKYLMAFLKATNIILSSSTKVIAGLEPLKEFKDFFELSFEMSNH